MSLAPQKFDPKPASASDLFYWDWTGWLAGLQAQNEAIVAEDTTITATPSDIDISAITLNGGVIRCRIAGGTALRTYTITCTVITAPSAIEDSIDAMLYVTR